MRDTPTGELVQTRDIARWLTFSSFWGGISYLLACVSLASASRRQPVRVNIPTTALGLGVHLASFVALGSATAAAAAFIRGKPTTQISQEGISSGSLERPKNIVGQGLGGAVGSLLPFALAIISQQAAERLIGDPAFDGLDDIRWPQAIAVMTGLSGLTALAVTRITGWVARDARSGKPPRQKK